MPSHICVLFFLEEKSINKKYIFYISVSSLNIQLLVLCEEKMLDHNECRKKVCVICSQKATGTKPLSSTDITSLKTYVDAEFSHENPDLWDM